MKLKLKASDPITEELLISLVKTINKQQKQINELETSLALELRLRYAKTRHVRRKRKQSQSLRKVFKG